MDADSVQALGQDPGGSVPMRLAGVRASPPALSKDGDTTEGWPAGSAMLRLSALDTACHVIPFTLPSAAPSIPKVFAAARKASGKFPVEL